MISLSEFLPEMIATIVGVALGGMGAVYSSRRQVKEIKRKRAKIFLKNLESEIAENMQVIEVAHQKFLANEISNFLNNNKFKNINNKALVYKKFTKFLTKNVSKEYTKTFLNL